MIELIRAQLAEQSAEGVARAVAVLAARGDISAGARLPTVRELAQGLGMGASTVGEAWRTLAAQGILDTQGRRGTFVRRLGEEPVRHFRHIHGAPVQIDLSTGYPDPALLPDLRPFLEGIAAGPAFTGYPEAALQRDLRELLDDQMPFSSGSVLLGTDALSTLTELLPVLLRYGDRVIVGSAEFAPYLDLLERSGAETAPVPFDEEGLSLEGLRTALHAGARLVLLQPRVHNPTGRVTTPERLAAIAHICQQYDAMIVEIDHFGDLSSSPTMSAGETAPGRTIYIRTYSKDLHPDLRVCVLAGPAHLLERLYERRVGGQWISGVNQRLLVAMLASPTLPKLVAGAKGIYDARRRTFVDELLRQGLEVHSRDGFNVWVPVRAEESALVYLAARGIGAAPGAPFRATASEPPHLRVSIAEMAHGQTELAQEISAAAKVRRLRAY